MNLFFKTKPKRSHLSKVLSMKENICKKSHLSLFESLIMADTEVSDETEISDITIDNINEFVASVYGGLHIVLSLIIGDVVSPIALPIFKIQKYQFEVGVFIVIFFNILFLQAVWGIFTTSLSAQYICFWRLFGL